MRSFNLLLLLMLTPGLPSFAQNSSHTITGIVTDIQSKPIAGASVSLLRWKDSTLQKTVASNEDGRFAFKKLEEQPYVIIVSYIGYKKYRSSAITIDSVHSNVLLPAIVLQARLEKTLESVVISTNKPLIERKVDRTVVNVDAMTGAAGNNVLEALEKSPGVTLGVDGDISLNGKGGVLVLIDDRSTYLSMQDLVEYLRSLPAALVDKIELMSNPPSRYDASGSAVINLILKKNKKPGFAGNASAGYSQGRYAGTSDALNLNYRKKKLSMFGNFSYSMNKGFNDDRHTRNFYNTDHSLHSLLFINNLNNASSTAWNCRTGIDYYASSKTTIGIQMMGSTRPRTELLHYHSDQHNENPVLDSSTEGHTRGKYLWRSTGINLNFQTRLNSSRMLSADIDRIAYHSNGEQNAAVTIYKEGVPVSLLARQFITPSDIDIYVAKADYTHPLNGKARLDAGIKSSQVTTDNNSKWFNEVNSVLTIDESKTNHFIYRENISALYGSGTKEWKRWAVQSGLRMEHVRSKGHLIGNAMVKDSLFDRSYADLFPTFYLSYKIDTTGDHTIRLSYERRIRRPNYQQLNPFLSHRDQYSYAGGNPNLLPHYNNFIQLEYGYKQYYEVSLLYGKVGGIIQQLTQAVGDSFITRPGNFGSNASVNLVQHLSINLVKIWNLNATVILFHLINKGHAYGQTIDNHITTGEVELINQLKLKNGWNAELSAFYASRHKGGQTMNKAFWTMSATVQKNILSTKGVLRFGLDDIFYTRKMQETMTGLLLADAVHTSRSDSQKIKLSFSYRFGKDTNKGKRNHDANGAAEEKDRAN